MKRKLFVILSLLLTTPAHASNVIDFTLEKRVVKENDKVIKYETNLTKISLDSCDIDIKKYEGKGYQYFFTINVDHNINLVKFNELSIAKNVKGSGLEL